MVGQCTRYHSCKAISPNNPQHNQPRMNFPQGPFTYIKGKRGLYHIETASDAPEAGIHICSVTSESYANHIMNALDKAM